MGVNTLDNIINDDNVISDVISTGQVLSAEISGKLLRTEAEVAFQSAMGRFITIILSKSFGLVEAEGADEHE